MLVSVAMSGLGAVGVGVGGVRGQLPAGGIRASQGTFSSLAFNCQDTSLFL